MNESDPLAAGTRALITQQEVVADLGQRALAGEDPDQLFYNASTAVAETLNHEYCKVLDLLPDGDELVLRQGVGWRDGLVESATVPTDRESQAGYTLLSEEPVVVPDLRTEDRFTGPELLTSHGVVSGISVVIGSVEEPWGVLGTHTTERREYQNHDVTFVRNVANILAQAIEHTRQKRRLRAENERFRRLVQNVDEYAIFTLDSDGHVASWNEGAERIKGYRDDEILGEHLSTFYPDAARSDGIPEYNLEQAVANGTYQDKGWRVRKDGTKFWADVTITALYDEKGALRGFTTVTQDLTDQRKQERTLERERDLLETTPIGVMVVDADGAIVRANARIGALYGCDPHELRGRNYTAIESEVTDQTGEVLPSDKYPVNRVLATGEPIYGVTIGLERTVGAPKWLSVSAAPVRGPDGAIERVVTAAEDVTERRRREQRLRAFREAVEHAGHAIFLMDTNGVIEYVNATFEEQTGYSFDDSLGETPRILRSGEHSRAFFTEIRNTILSGEVWTGEIIGQRKSGEKYTVNQTIAPITNADGDVERFIAINADVTAQKERKRALEGQYNTIQKLLETSPIGIAVRDADGELTHLNERAGALLGIPEGERGDYTVGDRPIYDEDGRPISVDEYPSQRVLETGEPVDNQLLKVERPDGGSRWVSVSAAPVFNEGGDIHCVITTGEDVTALQERKRTLERQQVTLEHQRNTLERLRQITASLNSIHRALIRASTRDELEQMVCDSLGSSEAYVDAWIGEYLVADEAIEPNAWMGLAEDDVAEMTDSVNENRGRDGIIERAIQTGEVHTTQEIVADSSDGSVHDPVHRGYNPTAAVPLTYGRTVYGVLCLRSNRSFAFDENERHLLDELGERIGYAIHATETRQLLHADTYVELEFRSRSPESSFVTVSDQLDCKLAIEKSTPVGDGALVYYVDVRGAPPEEICDRLAAAPEIDYARALQATGEKGTIECRITDSCLLLTLAESGATTQSAVVENGEARVVAETAPEADTRPIVERLFKAFPETELVSKRSVDRAVQTESGDGSAFGSLTDRQREVLEVAYRAGYFDSPRRSSGEDVAKTLGISSATFYQHVRKGSQKLLAGLTESGQ